MAKRKTEFDLGIGNGKGFSRAEIEIIGDGRDCKPYVRIETVKFGLQTVTWIKDKDLETFAINILKALKSKHLKQ